MKAELNDFIQQYLISGKDAVEVNWGKFNVMALPYPSLNGSLYRSILAEHEYVHVYLIGAFDVGRGRCQAWRRKNSPNMRQAQCG